MSADVDDRILVSRLLRGDEEAFSRFFETSFEPLLDFAIGRAGGDAPAATAVVEVTLRRAVRQLDGWRAELPLQRWLETKCAETLAEPPPLRRGAADARAAVHAEWQEETTRRARKRVFTSLAVAAVLAAFVVFVNCPKLH
ncbi:MAG TPA: hypothetical protein VNA04_09405 [Thermoanaerobaculia bacterium]|nr:hypothetical protein [Thermoanaerobaculia bacterium]